MEIRTYILIIALNLNGKALYNKHRIVRWMLKKTHTCDAHFRPKDSHTLKEDGLRYPLQMEIKRKLG